MCVGLFAIVVVGVFVGLHVYVCVCLRALGRRELRGCNCRLCSHDRQLRYIEYWRRRQLFSRSVEIQEMQSIVQQTIV